MKKYLIRFIAGLPMLASGLSMVVFFALSFDYLILALLCIGNFFSFIILSSYYERTVKDFKEIIRELTDKTPAYE
jgi:hypothetical protein